MIRAELLDFPPLNCSLDSVLGDYYQDLSPAIELVESGYHGGLDPDGVPLVRDPTRGSVQNAITTAQYGLANMIAFVRGDSSRRERARVQADWLVSAQERQGDFAGCWVMEHDNAKYPWLESPWTSALASGNAISALLRAWQLFGDDRYCRAADDGYRALHESRPGLPIYEQGDDELWYEEYPAEPRLRVLNGHVYALLGVADYARVTGDPLAHERWRLAASTLARRLPEYDLGYWSAYELRGREPATVHYQKNIHVPQLRILAELTGDPEFGAFASRWERQLGSRRSRLRWNVAIRAQRWRSARSRLRH